MPVLGTLAALILASGVSGVDAPCNDITFGNPEFHCGTGARAVALGDLNDDGLLDAVVTNEQDDTISVLIADGPLSFAVQVTYPAEYPKDLGLDDVDDDGDLDVLVVNALFSGTLSLLLNNGDGTLSGPSSIPAGTRPWSLTLADLDGDEDQDVVTADIVENSVYVLLSNGDGTYGAATGFATGPDTRAVAVGDFNGDDNPDIVATSWADNNVAVLLGNGKGDFGAPVTYAAGDAPSAVAAGDLDGDDDIDIATTNYTSNDFTILLNDGDAVFAAPVSYSDGSGRSLDIAIGDIEDDGDLDLVAPNQNSESASALINNGDGTFLPASYTVGGSNPSGIALGDLTGDGVLDLAVANFFGYDVALAAGRPDGTFLSNVSYETGAGPREIVAEDLDGDSILDLACTAFYDGTNDVAIHFGIGDGTFAAAVLAPGSPDGTGPQAIAAGDLDGNGSIDLALAYDIQTSLAVMLNNGDGTFAPATAYGQYLEPGNVHASDVVLGDLDGDEDLDMVGGGTNLQVLFNNGHGAFGEPVVYDPLSTYSFALEDIDADDDLDIAAADFFGAFADGFLTIWLNDGNGNFGEPTSYPAGISPGSVAFGDFDDDGDRDVVVANWFSSDMFPAPFVSIMEKDVNGEFFVADTVEVDERCRFASVGDLNDDGSPDIIVSNNVGDNASIALNQGNGTFSSVRHFGAGDGNWSHVLADLDGDDDLDIATADYLNDTVTVLINECLLLPCPADLDGNGTVNVEDMLALLASWGACPDCGADLDGDNMVGVADLLALLASWGPCQ